MYICEQMCLYQGEEQSNLVMFNTVFQPCYHIVASKKKGKKEEVAKAVSLGLEDVVRVSGSHMPSENSRR